MVISEYALGTPPLPQNFPLRNRIISGLSVGTLVIEGKESSGSIITAKCALEQGRDVFAVPGSIYNSASSGTNKLIDQGAKLVVKAEDVLTELNLNEERKFIDKTPPKYDNKEEELVGQILGQENLHIDKIAQLSKLNISVLSGILTIMEMKGLIKELNGKTFALTK